MANNWKEDELLLALHLYCRLPFGKLHQSNPDVIQLAQIIGRTPSAVAMKACNFASLDPALSQKGLAGASKADRALWDAFMNDSTAIAEQAEALYENKVESEINKGVTKPSLPGGTTETIREVKVRRVQRFFRQAVMQSYDYRCAISGLAMPELLVASHIIPWAANEKRRADPTNGIALNALYDKAFDKGLITFDEDLRVTLSGRLKEKMDGFLFSSSLLSIEGTSLKVPEKFLPDNAALTYHRENIFLAS
ncbi:HNH endonuclease [Cellvibrio sp. PSBB006]|uniref:HNH endonuclease n=1 Tax=Cellvibrio sp. PSBB006 TaxID=1987723 RepID=UPI000B3B58AA|nr:HNH endonuclease [Cellvibrio sp. PSBB006]ARU28496.1 hypothetical protein CBR65_14190 [Cellvibrio sp. PSBB006]